jgi:DNA-binding CsgD family transcriptional regulator
MSVQRVRKEVLVLQIQAQWQSSIRRQTGLEAFAAETMRLLIELSPVTWVTMHLFDECARRVWLGSRGIPPAFRITYYEGQMWRIDPLATTRSCGSERSLTGLQAQESRCQPQQVQSYRAFLRSFAVTDAAELVFVQAGEPIGGMSVLWAGAAGGSLSQNRELLTHLHRYIQLNFETALRNHSIGWRKNLVRAFGLTAREVDVVEGVCAGQSNQEVAEALRISPATVKTHLLHVFAKLQVSNRAALVRRALQ